MTLSTSLQKAPPIFTSNSSFGVCLHLHPNHHHHHHFHGSTTVNTTMQQCVDDLVDNIDNLHVEYASTEAIDMTITTETNHGTSSNSGTAIRTTSSHITSTTKPHAPPSDPCWDAIQYKKSDGTGLSLDNLGLLRRLGSGDIGSVYLVELEGSDGCMFAAKVMDKEELAVRNKGNRARIEREILEMLDHPFLPTLYAWLESDKWSCLLTEFCPGGDLHVLRQCQPDKRFREASVRFYASEVVVALEYLHMMGIIYRDLKPENVLIRSDGHIMLTDFDLSLTTTDPTSTAQVVSDRDPPVTNRSDDPHKPNFGISSCILPSCMVPAAPNTHPKRKRKKNSGHRGMLEIVAEPINVRSMSFVGTHEYLSPEIVSGEGHGNAVDWWTLGVFIFEMFYGVTPFKGTNHELTLANIMARALEFPKEPTVPGPAKDLIAQLLIKDPSRRLGSTMGATAIKHHPFFNGVNWALLRCNTPPNIPRPVACRDFAQAEKRKDNSVEYY
ncbi:hypothetical protein ACFX15_039472 [Malus domestica]|nr:serine/threonine-protein kinase D6PK-like [Malus domestica]